MDNCTCVYKPLTFLERRGERGPRGIEPSDLGCLWNWSWGWACLLVLLLLLLASSQLMLGKQ